MGDMADEAYEKMLIEDLEDHLAYEEKVKAAGKIEKEYCAGVTKWTTKQGEEILVQDMTDSHVKNTLNMLLKSEETPIRQAWINIFRWEIIKRKI